MTKSRRALVGGVSHNFTKAMDIGGDGVVTQVTITEAFGHAGLADDHPSVEMARRQGPKRTSNGTEVPVDTDHTFAAMPVPHGTAETTLRLLESRQVRRPESARDDATMGWDALLNDGMVEPLLLRHEDVRPELQRALDCVVGDMAANRTSTRTTACFRNATAAVRRLSPVGVSEWCDAEFSGHTEAPVSLSHHQVLVDLLVTLQTCEAQHCLVHNFIRAVNPDRDLVIRVLEGVSTVQQPCSELVEAVNDLAHRPQRFPAALQALELRHQATLMVGVVARRLHRQSPAAAAALLEPLETELGLYDGARFRRAADGVTLQTPTPGENDEWLRSAVLLEALGNAGLPSSSAHILSHATASEAPLRLRHSAVHALRLYRSPDVEDALLGRIFGDSHNHVRQLAVEVFAARPREASLMHAFQAVQDADGLMRSNVSLVPAAGSAVATRMRRTVDLVGDSRPDWLKWMKYIHYEIKVPSYNWGKSVGKPSILGADTGFIAVNEAELTIKDLYFYLGSNIHDEAWFTVSFFDEQLDIFRARLCFIGHMVRGIGWLYA